MNLSVSPEPSGITIEELERPSNADYSNRIDRDEQSPKYYPKIPISGDDANILKEALLYALRALTLRHAKNTSLCDMQKEYYEMTRTEVCLSKGMAANSKNYRKHEEILRKVLNKRFLKYSKDSPLERELYNIKKNNEDIHFNDVARHITGLHAARLVATEMNTIQLRKDAKQILKDGYYDEAVLIFFYLLEKIKTDSVNRCTKVVSNINDIISNSRSDETINSLVRVKSHLLTEISAQYIQNIYYIGKCYQHKKKLLRAYIIFKYSMIVFSFVFKNSSSLSAKILHSLGNCSYNLKNIEGAIQLFRTSLEILYRHCGANSPKYIANLVSLGKCYSKLQELPLSLIYSKLALSSK